MLKPPIFTEAVLFYNPTFLRYDGLIDSCFNILRFTRSKIKIKAKK